MHQLQLAQRPRLVPELRLVLLLVPELRRGLRRGLRLQQVLRRGLRQQQVPRLWSFSGLRRVSGLQLVLEPKSELGPSSGLEPPLPWALAQRQRPAQAQPQSQRKQPEIYLAAPL